MGMVLKETRHRVRRFYESRTKWTAQASRGNNQMENSLATNGGDERAGIQRQRAIGGLEAFPRVLELEAVHLLKGSCQHLFSAYCILGVVPTAVHKLLTYCYTVFIHLKDEEPKKLRNFFQSYIIKGLGWEVGVWLSGTVCVQHAQVSGFNPSSSSSSNENRKKFEI